MEPRYFEVPISSFAREKGASTAMARWICLPYFSLKQYGGLLSATNVALFPDQTLLQGQYSRATEQRDMQQAVCQLGTANRGECFHISQLWCLTLDNSKFHLHNQCKSRQANHE